MASRTITSQSQILQFAVITIVGGGLLLVLVMKHYEISLRELTRTIDVWQNAAAIVAAEANLVTLCDQGETLSVFSRTVYVCDSALDTADYRDIYQTYPAAPSGRHVMYSFIDRGVRAQADEMMDDMYYIRRYEPVTIPAPIDWRSDPFGERYWRFLFYSLRPVRHLLAAGEETGNEAYYQKAAEIISSFATEGIDSPYAWDDAHGVAFRTMVLVHAWWTLREAGQLDAQLSGQILTTLRLHGDYLLQPENYEEGNNHAVTQGAALLLLAHNFPDLENAAVWREVAIERITDSLTRVIDPDGVLVENSPYYHFYVLEKYWEIYAYKQREDITMSDAFDGTVEKMITFGTHVIRPDLTIPLLGASIPRQFTHSSFYQKITDEQPELAFVLTQGTRGREPAQLDTWYPSSGIALWRSGWGTERAYVDEGYVLFDTGPYRTDHSDLDALTFSFYGLGTPVIRDAGLYTYETEHPFYRYFYGTRGHNTVMVDGYDQAQGTGTTEPIEYGSGHTVLAARHELYEGVTHARTLVFLKPHTVVVADMLFGTTTHQYEQLFHFPPGTDFNDVTPTLLGGHVSTPSGGETHFQLEQLLPPTDVTTWTGTRVPIRGWCAERYEVRVPCPEVAFTNYATNTQFLTVINLGRTAASDHSSYDTDQNTLSVRTAAEEMQNLAISWPTNAMAQDGYIDVTVEESHSPHVPSAWERARDMIQFWLP